MEKRLNLKLLLTATSNALILSKFGSAKAKFMMFGCEMTPMANMNYSGSCSG